jgi:hypothetical protein
MLPRNSTAGSQRGKRVLDEGGVQRRDRDVSMLCRCASWVPSMHQPLSAHRMTAFPASQCRDEGALISQLEGEGDPHSMSDRDLPAAQGC